MIQETPIQALMLLTQYTLLSEAPCSLTLQLPHSPGLVAEMAGAISGSRSLRPQSGAPILHQHLRLSSIRHSKEQTPDQA